MKEFVRGAIVCLLLAPAICAGVADRPPPVRGLCRDRHSGAYAVGCQGAFRLHAQRPQGRP